ncbi:MAG: type II toxin-antitoxin system RelE/ParE family toxin [Thermoanaerobaculia bacterium]
MGRYVLTAAARADLSEIAELIRQDSPGAARKVVKSLRDAMAKLAGMPQMGHIREDLARTSLRFWPVYSYLIIYDPQSRPIQVVRILHGARDVRALMDED